MAFTIEASGLWSSGREYQIPSMTRDPSQSSDETNSASELDEQVQDAILTAISDPGCRAILQITSDRALTATELSEALDLPLSTVYRKLNRLTNTSLLEKTHRLGFDGKHPSQYRCTVDRIHIKLSESDQDLLTSIGRSTRKEHPTRSSE